ncbi:hypothetical protein JCM10207_001320 [Rhodosporidiobolus poonsookiae]
MPKSETKRKLSPEALAWNSISTVISGVGGPDNKAWREEMIDRLKGPFQQNWQAWQDAGQDKTIKAEIRKQAKKAVPGFNPDEFPPLHEGRSRKGHAHADAMIIIKTYDPGYRNRLHPGASVPQEPMYLAPEQVQALLEGTYGSHASSSSHPHGHSQNSLAHGHNYRRISHRAAYHYGTTKEAWEAGRAW